MNIEDIAGRLDRLEAIQAIEILKARYVRACDRKQPAAVRACFTDDARIDFEGFPLFTDPDAFVAIFEQWGCQPHIVDMHHLNNAIVEVTGPDTARARFDLFFFQIDMQARRHTQLAVDYDDDLRRVDGEWRIARSVSRRMSMLVRDLGEDELERVTIAARSDEPGPAAAPR
ncbi:nuclear transport factor 2 family protein [Sphingomonas sp. RP10(2022)]|uniref:Nuclear transport factor 2 family protein n=1 Tax=Sphingomonas liriopis TaxID=2949094 RepID=A0A9X2HQZ1_9SPHN|nr:nuclear transport factor 2 family protein [Sphingomonas liriopis]MCP3735901.1 nuclear transport factor 2 family protein [Sphingomonas liriopis]